MKFIETGLKDCYIIEPNKIGDDRGYFCTFFAEKDIALTEISRIMNGVTECNRSLSKKGVLRGLHFLKEPYTQTKIVECLSGGVLDVVVDLRKDSPTYKKSYSIELTPENGRQLLVPRGFAHGFVSLKDNTLFQYLVDNDYSNKHDDGVYYKDNQFNIDWNLKKYGIENPIISEKDTYREPYDEEKFNFYTKKRYMVTGYSGQLGYDVVRELNKRGIYDILTLTKEDLDITDKRRVNKIINDYKPEILFHCAAYTNVEEAEKNKEDCFRVNVNGTENIVEACKRNNTKLIYISSDYVYDGTKEDEYEIDDKLNPLNVYGESKKISEEIVSKYNKSFIVRTSWLFGINGDNFIKKRLKDSETKKELNIVSDQIGSPTYTVDLAKVLVDMSETEKYGIYNATNTGFCSWAELTTYLFDICNKETKVNYIKTTNNTIAKAKRPLNSKLSKKSLILNGFKELPDWKDAVKRFIKEME